MMMMIVVQHTAFIAFQYVYCIVKEVQEDIIVQIIFIVNKKKKWFENIAPYNSIISVK